MAFFGVGFYFYFLLFISLFIGMFVYLFIYRIIVGWQVAFIALAFCTDHLYIYTTSIVSLSTGYTYIGNTYRIYDWKIKPACFT